ncbi:hypothetical protein ES708_08759 [subsurface metagenome]
MGWVSPTAFSDPSAHWVNEPNIYDGSLATRCTGNTRVAYSWSDYLELTLAAINSDNARLYPRYTTARKWEVDVYKDDAWVNVHSGDYGSLVANNWNEFPFTQGTVSKVRIRWQHNAVSDISCDLYEFEFWEVELPPPAGRSFGYIIG